MRAATLTRPPEAGSAQRRPRRPTPPAVAGLAGTLVGIVRQLEEWAASVSDGAFLSAMAVIALALRIPRVAIAYWGDEAISVGIASRTLHQIPTYLRFDGSPPLYYFLLHYWIRAFGSSPVATHTLSLLISLATIPVAWWCARALFGARAARPAALMAAVCPYLAYYGTETRMYSIVALAAMPAVTGVVVGLRAPASEDAPTLGARLRRDPANRWLALGAGSTLVVLYTHNWGLFLTAALILTGLVTARWLTGGQRPAGQGLLVDNRTVMRRTLVFAAAVAAGYAPWVPSFFWQLRYTGAPWAPRPGVLSFFLNPLDAMFSATVFTVEATRVVVGPAHIDLAYLAVWLLVVAGLAALVGRRYQGRRRLIGAGGDESLAVASTGSAALDPPAVAPTGIAGAEPGRRSTELWLTGSVVIFTLMMAWIASQVVHAWASRYLGVVIAPGLLVIAGVAAWHRWARCLLPLLAVVMSVAALPVLVDPPAASTTKSNVAAVDAAMAPLLAPGDLVISTAPSELPLIAYYLPRGLHYASVLGPAPDPRVVDWIDLTSRLAAADPRTSLARTIADMPAGAKVLLINPVNWATTETPERYAGVVAAAGIAVNQMVLTDPELTVIHTDIPRHPGASANPVEGVLLVKGP